MMNRALLNPIQIPTPQVVDDDYIEIKLSKGSAAALPVFGVRVRGIEDGEIEDDIGMSLGQVNAEIYIDNHLLDTVNRPEVDMNAEQFEEEISRRGLFLINHSDFLEEIGVTLVDGALLSKEIVIKFKPTIQYGWAYGIGTTFIATQGNAYRLFQLSILHDSDKGYMSQTDYNTKELPFAYKAMRRVMAYFYEPVIETAEIDINNRMVSDYAFYGQYINAVVNDITLIPLNPANKGENVRDMMFTQAIVNKIEINGRDTCPVSNASAEFYRKAYLFVPNEYITQYQNSSRGHLSWLNILPLGSQNYKVPLQTIGNAFTFYYIPSLQYGAENQSPNTANDLELHNYTFNEIGVTIQNDELDGMCKTPEFSIDTYTLGLRVELQENESVDTVISQWVGNRDYSTGFRFNMLKTYREVGFVYNSSGLPTTMISRGTWVFLVIEMTSNSMSGRTSDMYVVDPYTMETTKRTIQRLTTISMQYPFESNYTFRLGQMFGMEGGRRGQQQIENYVWQTRARYI